MKRNLSVLLGALCTVLFLLPPNPALAQNAKPPTQLTYQGFLTDGSGVPFGNTTPVNKTIFFRIYDALTGGTLKWSSQQVITVDKGYFSALLGQGSAVGGEPFTADLTSVFTGSSTVSDRYLELNADGTPIAPRLRFLPAPYAVLARSATELLDPVTGSSSLAIASGNITASGTVTATGFSGSGASLNSLNASQLAAGTLADARLSGTYSSAVTMSNPANTLAGNGTIPLGGIIMWSGAVNAVPTGWALCNGGIVNGRTTPNLVDKFVVGAGGAYAVAAGGGSTAATLVAGNLPTFDLQYWDVFFSEATGVYNYEGKSTTSVPGGFGGNGSDRDNVGYQISRTATRTGTATAFSILPPYYALAFIMRVQ